MRNFLDRIRALFAGHDTETMQLMLRMYWGFAMAPVTSLLNFILTGWGLLQWVSAVLSIILVMAMDNVTNGWIVAWFVFTLLCNNGIIWILALIAMIAMLRQRPTGVPTPAPAPTPTPAPTPAPAPAPTPAPWSKEISIISLFRKMTIVYDGDTSYTMVITFLGIFKDTTDLCLCYNPDICSKWSQVFGITHLCIDTKEVKKFVIIKKDGSEERSKVYKKVYFWIFNKDSIRVISFLRSRITEAVKAGDMKRLVP